MKLDVEKIEEVYGKSAFYELDDNMDNLISNMKYLLKLGFDDIYDIVGINPYLFLIDEKEFKEKIDNLINSLGLEYLEILAEDISYWSDIEC